MQVRAGEHGVELVVGGERLLAHQADLATASPLLSRCFNSQLSVCLSFVFHDLSFYRVFH